MDNVFSKALNFMTGESKDSSKNRKVIEVCAKDIQYLDRFIDSNGAEYVVKDIKVRKGITCVYGHTDSDNADGWFTRDSYNVVVE